MIVCCFVHGSGIRCQKEEKKASIEQVLKYCHKTEQKQWQRTITHYKHHDLKKKKKSRLRRAYRYEDFTLPGDDHLKETHRRTKQSRNCQPLMEFSGNTF